MDWGRNEKYPDCTSFRKIARWEHSIKPLSSLQKSFWERSLFSLLGLWWSSGICNDIETTFLRYNLHIILKQTIILYQGYNVYYFDKFLRPSTCWAWMRMFADVMWIKTRLKQTVSWSETIEGRETKSIPLLPLSSQMQSLYLSNFAVFLFFKACEVTTCYFQGNWCYSEEVSGKTLWLNAISCNFAFSTFHSCHCVASTTIWKTLSVMTRLASISRNF